MVVVSYNYGVLILTHDVIDGGQEVIEARFVHPIKALDECREGKISFMPPQYYLLSTLADILHGAVNTSDQRQKVETLSHGTFGKMVINPRKIGEDQSGRSILAYEGDETHGGSKGRLHRALVRTNGAVSSFQYISRFSARHSYFSPPWKLTISPQATSQ